MLLLILVFLAAVQVFAVPQYDEYDATDQDSRTVGRIIGGVPATIEEFPYLVFIITTIKIVGLPPELYRCGGSIITKDWVLTAAHCLEPGPSIRFVIEKIDVRAGSTYPDRGGVMRRVTKTVSHVYPPHDIALIKVDEPWPFNGITISLARLPRQGDPIPVYKRATIMGWGGINLQGTFPDRLLKGEVLVISLDYCRTVHSHWWPGDNDPRYQVTAEKMCTLFDPAKKPSKNFRGDSGSPILVNGEVVAIVSWGRIATLYAPDVQTRTSSYIHWIESRVGPLP